MRQATRAEYDAFIAAYPRPLERDISHMVEPPMVSYDDFTLGKWPESMVAKRIGDRYWIADGEAK